MRILLVDDDEQLMNVLANALIAEHYAVDIANTGDMGWDFIELFDYDLLVLDLMLPDINGIELCQKIRSQGYQMPIMILSACDRNIDKVAGLDAGADDYAIKPFDFAELTARIRALLRREISIATPILQWQELSLDPKTHEIFCQQELLPLTPKEYSLIELLMRHPHQVFSPSAIINNLWAGEDPPGEEAVRTHIKCLRQKLAKAGMAKDSIETVYGVGYRLKKQTTEIASKTSEAKTQFKKELKISEAWVKFQEATEQRLENIEKLVQALAKDSDFSDLLCEARSSAHKLAGSLGGFGFPEGSNLAKKIENLLADEPIIHEEKQKLTYLLISIQEELQKEPFAERVSNALEQKVSVFIIGQNRTFIKALVKAAERKQMKTAIAYCLEEAAEILEKESPALVLQLLDFSDRADLIFLAKIHQKQPQLPLVVVTEDISPVDRLAIIRRGGNLILQAPVEPEVAIDSAIELLKNSGNNAKVLLVDDDPQVLLSLEIALQPWNFQLVTLSDTQQFWDVLGDFQPDLLVLDVEMPELNGLELCQLLRSDRRWQNLPILFLTVSCDAKTENQAFAFGADDYLCKPVIGSELASRILNRLRRSQVH